MLCRSYNRKTKMFLNPLYLDKQKNLNFLFTYLEVSPSNKSSLYGFCLFKNIFSWNKSVFFVVIKILYSRKTLMESAISVVFYLFSKKDF